MPNTPLQVGAGCTALTKISGKINSYTELNAKVVKEIFSQSGIVETVDEGKFHAITALSGSGPAYAYIIIEALSDAALKQGLTRDLATKFAAQTLLGASKTLLESNLNTCKILIFFILLKY
jgi:pyrroline-5-carboxylate reductase